MIKRDDYINQHAAFLAPGELTPQIEANADVLCSRVNAMLDHVGLGDRKLRSGLRPAAFNATFVHHDEHGNVVRGGAAKSTHMTGEGVDVEDGDGELDKRITDEVLEMFGLYREAPASTPGWCHLDIKVRSHRTYIP